MKQPMLNLSIIALLFSFAMGPTGAQTKERKAELLRFAMENVNQENYTIAEQALDKLIALDATNTDAYFLRGYCRYMKGEPGRCLAKH